MSFAIGPLFYLQWLGVLCPCLQKDEDRNARQALKYINEVAERVLWVKSATSASSGLTNFSLGNLFRGGGNDSRSSNGAQGTSPTLAKLSLHDTPSGVPAVWIDPRKGAFPSEEATTDDAESEGPDVAIGSSSFQLKIHLGRIDKVSLENDDIVLLAKPVRDAGSSSTPAKELARIRVLDPNNNNCPVPSDQRNTFVHHFAVLVEWERQRRAADPDAGYDDEEEEDNEPNFLQARARKAAHFAKRELELQQTKRDRERRKAKLVAESGGLKYTALAMAASSS